MALSVPTSTQPRMSVDDFDQLAALPENDDVILELINGEVIEVPSNPLASHISSRLNRAIMNFVEEKALGWVTGEAGGYMVSGERYAPDVAFISKEKQPQLATSGYNPNPPDLAVEVDFPSSPHSGHVLRFKIANYLRAGTIVWVITPETRIVEVWMPDQPPQLLGENDMLDGGTVLPGFRLAVKTIYAGIQA